MNDLGHFWDPALTGFTGVYYWPPGVPRSDGLDAWTRLFGLFGYRECASAALETGAEKIAIYATFDGEAHHVARQLPSGFWTSQLGGGEDIEHPTLQALAGSIYGEPVKFMRRAAL